MKKAVSKFLLLNLGCLVAATPAAFFFSKASIPPGGMYSVALIIYNFFKFSGDANTIISAIAWSLNVPLLLAAFKIFGLEYLMKVIYASFAYPTFVMLIGMVCASLINQIAPGILTIIILGGVLQGVGVALTIHSGANTGGTDIIGQIISHFFPGFTVGFSIGMVNMLIMGVAIAVLGASNTLYGVVIILITSYVIDLTLRFLKRAN